MKKIVYGALIIIFSLTAISCERLGNYWQSLQADTAYNQGNLEKAIAIYKDLLKKQPNDPNLHFKLALCYFSGGNLLGVRKEILKLEHLKRSDLADQLRGLLKNE